MGWTVVKSNNKSPRDFPRHEFVSIWEDHRVKNSTQAWSTFLSRWTLYSSFSYFWPTRPERSMLDILFSHELMFVALILSNHCRMLCRVHTVWYDGSTSSWSHNKKNWETLVLFHMLYNHIKHIFSCTLHKRHGFLETEPKSDPNHSWYPPLIPVTPCYG
jgi:hypothetical protein